jgi:hypothetical protein
VLVSVTDAESAYDLGAVTLALPSGKSSNLPVYTGILSLFGIPTATISATVTDAFGSPVTAPIALWSSNPAIATIDANGNLRGKRPGPVTIYASLTAYGVTRTDSLPLVMFPSQIAGVTILSRKPVGSDTPVPYLQPGTVTVSQYAVVSWTNNFGSPLGVVFDDSTNVGAVPDSVNFLKLLGYTDVGVTGGNIASLSVGTPGTIGSGADVRYFPHPGTYTFHIREFPDVSGTLTVVPTS